MTFFAITLPRCLKDIICRSRRNTSTLSKGHHMALIACFNTVLRTSYDVLAITLPHCLKDIIIMAFLAGFNIVLRTSYGVLGRLPHRLKDITWRSCHNTPTLPKRCYMAFLTYFYAAYRTPYNVLGATLPHCLKRIISRSWYNASTLLGDIKIHMACLP